MVVLNARAAAERGAMILTRTRCLGARREDGYWRVRLQSADGGEETVQARALVNAAGPWAQAFIERELALPTPGRLRLVKGSHIVVPRLYAGEHAYILQNPDRRVVFLVPFGDDLTAIGTTDIPVAESDYTPAISDAEIDYLCGAASRYTARAITPDAVVHTWSGVRALFDDGAANPSAVTREYRLMLDAKGPPLLSIFGGKITTYRRLAERALAMLRPCFPTMDAPWTHGVALPGGDFGGRDFEAEYGLVRARLAGFDPAWLRALMRRHGTAVATLLEGVHGAGDLGAALAPGLYDAELRYLVANEWARTTDDVLWRRTKAGLRASASERDRVAQRLARLLARPVAMAAGH